MLQICYICYNLILTNYKQVVKLLNEIFKISLYTKVNCDGAEGFLYQEFIGYDEAVIEAYKAELLASCPQARTGSADRVPQRLYWDNLALSPGS